MTNWNYFNKFETLTERYLPRYGDGDTLATQAVTAVCKLVYKHYNDGDVYDNTNGILSAFGNDISGSANWLAVHVKGAREILDRVFTCYSDEAYTDILRDIADLVLDEEFLAELDKEPRAGDAYNEDGPYRLEDEYEDEDDYWF